MAQNDIVVLQEQSDGSLKEVLLTAALINAQEPSIVSETAPNEDEVQDGQTWIRSTDLQKFFLYNDGDSRTWVQLPPPHHTHPQNDIDGLESDMIAFSLAFGG